MTTPNRRIAIVHDALVNTGGAERVVLQMHRVFPDAPIFTSVYLPDRTYPEFAGASVRPFRWAKFVRNESGMKRLWWLAATGFAGLRLDGFDCVLTSSTFAAKAVRVPAGALHASYCYAPFRLIWHPESYLPEHLPAKAAVARVMRAAFAPLRVWDRRVSRRAHRTATTCLNMVRSLRACYGIEARVLHAPIEWGTYSVSHRIGDFYLVVSRLNRYKRIDLAIEACNRLSRRLVIVGEGPLRHELEARATAHVTFLGRQPEAELRRLYSTCRALIFPSDEDYGLVPLEAQASGRPVVALGRGGALETIVPGSTGVFFSNPVVDDVVEAIRRAESMPFDPQAIREHARRFDVPAFTRGLTEFTEP